MRPATIVGWTGKGSLGDLERAVRGSLAADGVRAFRASRAARTLVGSGAEPVIVSKIIANLPGVSWIAFGYEFPDGLGGLARTLAVLSRKYLKRGMSFGVSADAKGSYSKGDVILTANSTVLSTVKGTRVDENRPSVRFRISLAGSGGACGVQIRDGVDGVPTSSKRIAYCLVSGGRHSSVAAWTGALAGFSLRLVHARVDDASLRQVARLYSELTYRMNPSSVSLELVEGTASARDILRSWLRERQGLPILVGSHLECGGNEALEFALASSPRMLFPVMLLQEEAINSAFAALGMKEGSEAPSGILAAGADRFVSYKAMRVKRGRTDIHAVLDALLR